jgi:hypothetical protein
LGQQGNQVAPSTAGSAKDIDVRVFLFGIGRDKLEAAGAEAGLSVQVANELRRADVVLTTKTHYRRGSQLVRVAESSGTPVYVLRKNTMLQVQEFLRTIAKERGVSSDGAAPPEDDSKLTLEQAMQEAEEAANLVLSGEALVRLSPQRSYVRRLQHLLGERYNVSSVSRGREPERSVTFYKP